MAYEFDFQQYVDRKKSPGGGKAERGGFGDYAFSGDLRVLRQIERLTPVRMVVEATIRLWKSFQKNEMLGTSVKLSRRQFPHLHDLVVECSEILDIPVPTVYVAQSADINAGTYGTNQESFIFLTSAIVDAMSDEELKFVIGHECGHIQNSHVVYHTAARFMSSGVGVYLKYASLPASVALNAWSRRGEVTCDRAGMVCVKDADVAIATMLKLALGKSLSETVDLDEYMTQLDELSKGVGRFQELLASHPYIPKRVEAMRLFAQSSYFKALRGEKGGRPLDEIDREVEAIIEVM